MLSKTPFVIFILSALALIIVLPFSAVAQDGEGGPPMAAAYDAMGQGDWDTAHAVVAGAGPVARDLVTWTRLRNGAGTFDEYVRFLARRGDWPGTDRIRSAAEEAMPEGELPAAVFAFFDGRTPETGEGVVRLAEAYFKNGERTKANEVLIAAWTTLGLTEEGHAAIINTFGDIVAPYHAARAEMLLWRWRTTDTQQLMPLLGEDQAALAAARTAYIRDDGDIAQRVAAVPATLRSDIGLAYDRFSWLAGRGESTDAIEILRAQSLSEESLGQPWRWASWRRVLARWEMREGRSASAYDLATSHYLTEGSDFADLEWLAGYIALTYMDSPATALAHFETFSDAVSSPISVGRAGYWLGRAHDALGNADAATESYQMAARYQTGFYGLLAADHLGLPLDPELVGDELFADWQEAAFLTGDLTQAALLLLAADQRGLAVLFLAELGRTLDREGLAQLGNLMMELNEPFYALLVAKAAAERDIVLPHIYFPLHDLAGMDLPVEPALAMSIARRESEFRADAGSPVGALGLMQLMPATAQEVAAELGLSFQRARLTSDWEYNATLGSQYLANLQVMFGNSPVMIAAGYNAGPSRPRSWMDERGDPRVGAADVVDWIEHIPFRETRNYVMRVTESIPIYRARLSGETGALQFRAMLEGVKPIIRPRARPDTGTTRAPASQDGAFVLPPIRGGTALGPSAPSGPQKIRPVARPGSG